MNTQKDNMRTKLLREIKDEIVNGKKLPLYKERIKNKVFPVIGEGSHYAKIMFIGEAPGKNEAQTGRPFCGASGKVLDQFLEFIGIVRQDVYVTNIVKDRPPMNRDPLPDEIKAYSSYLDRQINIIQPKVIATLGRFSMVYVMQRYGLESELKSISQIHGRMFNTEIDANIVKVIPLYHPAVAVYNSNMKDTLEQDFKALRSSK